VFTIANMNTTPGLAKHKLYAESGVLMDRQLSLPAGKFPKNDLFVAGVDAFIKVPKAAVANGMTMTNTELAALKSALKTGQEFYEIGLCSGGACNTTRRFADVWDWHRRLHDVTAALSQAETEEYERRRARFRALLEQWAAAVNHEKSIGAGMQLEPAVVLPFDMRAYDPFERYTHERAYIERGRDVRQLFKQRFGPEILEMPRDQALQQIKAKQQMQGARSPSGAATPVGVLAAPAATPAPPKPSGKVVPTTPPPNVEAAGWLADETVSKCLTGSDWGFEMTYEGPISCRIAEFLLGEWRRKAAGQKSCLDLGNPECDWTPQMFEAGVLDQVQRLDVQVADEEYCRAYLEPQTFVDDPNNGGLSTVLVVQKRLDATRDRVEKELKAVSKYLRPRTAKGQPLGKDWEGGDFLGDKNWFAAGYEYGLGWNVSPAEKTGDGRVCKVEGAAHGEMGFDAWIVGNKIPVVDGAVRAEAKAGNGGEARFNAHLEMMGQSVFNTDGWKLAQTFEPTDRTGWAVKIPPGLKPRFDIYVGVPVSGQMWGELMFGSTLALGGAGPNGCDPDSPRLAVGARYAPFFGAFGVGQVGVGIAGIASAGIRASLTLVMLGMPAEVDMQAHVKSGKPVVSFGSELGLMLATLAGRVSLYVEFLMFDEEFELFRWKGWSTQVPLMPRLTADVSLVGLK
jgi:hypothetical protein